MAAGAAELQELQLQDLPRPCLESIFHRLGSAPARRSFALACRELNHVARCTVAELVVSRECSTLPPSLTLSLSPSFELQFYSMYVCCLLSLSLETQPPCVSHYLK